MRRRLTLVKIIFFITWLFSLNLCYSDNLTGYNSLFIGHSFFRPVAKGIERHAQNLALSDHQQVVIYSRGETGSPEALWNNAQQRLAIQSILNENSINLFGMTYHPKYHSIEGYKKWIEYALAQNPDTKFFIAMPWLRYPQKQNASAYKARWYKADQAVRDDILLPLKTLYPSIEITYIPYGKAALKLYSLYEQGKLANDISSLINNKNNTSIYKDKLGHPNDILIELSELIWLEAIYDIDLTDYTYQSNFDSDLKSLAVDILNEP